VTDQQNFDPEEFLALADRLSKGTSQAELRSAISRAYYAVFLRAREEMASSGTTTGTSSDHAIVARAQSRQARGNLNTLRRMRNRADYNLQASFSQIDARVAVMTAGRLEQR
jgi:cytosine/adenosine deaminase-related metal-dependent hydrolase